ncbi:hypothetical protein M409DRAFT_67100 [Zasmidium cellare ATCC 36951]|uniref:Histidine kinase n=1 Tax=Zasmidium cellare ATCC 36951 TaxID=1080233 RepID=A0A6A6CJ79_ZASCE|nr:uncharacterized protein M409DRAFT_67100 [Zasmidium cellare ATCC 36951]KAF2165759.1 hypothetical protein M409DRAFT_67100 [Zasmidium cellare ATCC 36951]
MCMNDPKPTMLWWGPERIAIYNEGYGQILANKHPAALGKTAHEIWPELTDTNIFETAWELGDRTGETSFAHRDLFLVQRNDYVEEAYASWSIIPIPGPNGNLGFYNMVIEVTQDVLNERRMTLLHKLEQCLSSAETVRDFYTQVLAGLQSDAHEIPFAALYGPASRVNNNSLSSAHNSPDDDECSSSAQSEPASVFAQAAWTLKGVIAQDSGPEYQSNSLPSTIDLDSGSALFTPWFRDCIVTKTVAVLQASEGTLPSTLVAAAKPREPQYQPLAHAVLLPIWTNYQEHRSGFLILGLNSRRPYDADYQRFIRLLHNQLTTTLASLVMAEEEARRNRVAARLAARDRIRLVEQLAERTHQVQQSEIRFRSMADFAPIGIFELNAVGQLQYANEQWIELTSCRLDQLQDFETFTNALVEEDRQHAWREWKKLEAGEQVRFECRLDRSFTTDEVFNGERMMRDTWILVAAYALRDDDHGPSSDQVKGVFGCLVDISRQKWIEGFQERQARLQQERRRQQENFMDSTNHEARNPLAAITLCAEDVHSTMESLVQQSQGPRLSMDRDTALAILEGAEIIMSCAKHQKTIIDDVLTLSKLDSNMLSVSPEPVHPVSILDQAIKMFRGEVQRSDVELVYTIDTSFFASKVDWLLLDATRFLQVLVNLLNNAVKFTQRAMTRRISIVLGASTSRPTDKAFGVRFAPVAEYGTLAEGASEEGVYLNVSVTDTGPGMSDEELNHLFEKFRQASPKTYAQYGGTGLGLWICKELCAKLGGQIGVASHLSGETQADSIGQGGSGSTFAFYVYSPRCDSHFDAQKEVVSRNDEAKEPEPQVQNPTVQHKNSITIELPTSHEGNGTNITNIPQATSPSTSLPTTDIHILIVEDNLMNQKVLHRQLSRAGYTRISIANHASEDGNEGISVILMDFEMPVMGGLECTRIIRQKEQEQQSLGHRWKRPIIGVTANARTEQQEAAMKVGMDCVVTKPFQMRVLLDAIEKVRENV